MANAQNRSSREAGAGSQQRAGKNKSKQQIVNTWVFDSAGPRKYALQIRRASNGNPCLKIVEGVPQGDGSYRRFELTFWSEDFPVLFQKLDEVRAYMDEHNIKTPEGHWYDPNAPRHYEKRRRSKTPDASRGAANATPPGVNGIATVQ